ncbi:MAG TPA: hypothetical protein VHN15_09120 [Thermoanaerobaculia bacterium]|nr:hypothetical protein [Thermoanaerobaculia bacterium]
MVDAEIRRLSRHLEALLRLRKVPIRALERQLGFGGGTMNRIFSGKIELKVRHILLILEVLDIEPARFFHHVYAEPDKPLTDEQVLKTTERLNRRRPEEEAEAVREPTIPMSQLQAAVLEVLKRIEQDPPEEQEKPKKRGSKAPAKTALKKGAKKPARKPEAGKPPTEEQKPPESE